MIRLTLRTLAAGVMLLACTTLAAAEPVADEMPTREWTATRQPREVRPPLPADGLGSDFALADRETTPLSISLFEPAKVPWGTWDVRGVRLSPVYGCCNRLTGLDLGLVNTVETDLTGVQFGALNTTARARGLQIGLINCAYYLKGVQIGVVNYAEGAKGLQIGVVNVITDTTPGMLPLIYGSF